MVQSPSPAFDDILMLLASQLAYRSHCVKKQVGAVLAKETRVISTGYNGPPAGTYNCDEIWPKTGCARNEQGNCALAIHAEQNAILYALSNCIKLRGAVLYLTLSPCLPCARIIYSVGIHKVIYRDFYAAYKGLAYEEGLDFLQEFGVIVQQYVYPLG